MFVTVHELLFENYATDAKVHSIQHGSNITCSIKCKYRIAATPQPWKMICFGYVVVNTLRKCGNKN